MGRSLRDASQLIGEGFCPFSSDEGEDVFISFRGSVKRKLVLFVVATWYKKGFFFFYQALNSKPVFLIDPQIKLQCTYKLIFGSSRKME